MVPLKKIKIKFLLLLAILPIFIITTALYTGYLYSIGKKSVMKGVDDRLLTAAYGVKLFADSYHDRISYEHPISPMEYLKVLLTLSEFSWKINVEYAYTMIIYDNKIVFTSDSSTPEEFAKNDHTKFLQEYTDASVGLREAFRDKKIHYDEYTDQWGTFRSIFVPTASKGGKEYVIGIDIKISYLKEMVNRVIRNSLVICVSVFLISLISVILIARSITQPLSAMALATADIATGNLDTELPPVKSGDEIRRLGEAFEHMKTSLKKYIQELAETTAAKERIESELKIAHDIQMSILPKLFPPFPDRPEFDIYAMIEPAREVGGDFYDFFFIDNDHLCFVIADVSDKGIPASLLMMVTKTLIKANTTTGSTPDEILMKVNNELCGGNDSSMFVTIFCGILNTQTGEVLYANGGHNPPLIIGSGREATFLEKTAELVVGITYGIAYTKERMVLQPGDSLFLYTDGVTEAMNEKNELFSEGRLITVVTASEGKSVQETIDGVMGEIGRFSLNTPQADDITMMMIRFNGTG